MFLSGKNEGIPYIVMKEKIRKIGFKILARPCCHESALLITITATFLQNLQGKHE
jgi:hypothetical protein